MVCDNEWRPVGALLGLALQRLRAGCVARMLKRRFAAAERCLCGRKLVSV